MRLRNKETGETGYLELEKGDDEKYTGLRVYKNDFMYKRYDSLAGVLEEWEDYEPKEPLIKDEKVRKAVRAWAEAVGGSPVCFYEDTGYEGVGRLKIYREGYPAVFDLGHQFYDLELDTQYTIDELCGEEEG